MAEKKIGSRTFSASKMPASEGFRNLTRLTKLIGPGLPKLAGIMNGSNDVRDMQALEGIVDILVASDPDELTAFVIEIAEKAEIQAAKGVDYEPVIFDHHFDDLGEALQVTAFVLQVNYADFFGGKLGGALRSADKHAKG